MRERGRSSKFDSKRVFIAVLLLLMGALAFSSCGYRMVGSEFLSFKSVTIQSVKNQTYEPRLEERLQEWSVWGDRVHKKINIFRDRRTPHALVWGYGEPDRYNIDDVVELILDYLDLDVDHEPETKKATILVEKDD